MFPFATRTDTANQSEEKCCSQAHFPIQNKFQRALLKLKMAENEFQRALLKLKMSQNECGPVLLKLVFAEAA